MNEMAGSMVDQTLGRAGGKLKKKALIVAQRAWREGGT